MVATGIGSIPDAVLAALTNHKDLGIHSEMFAGGVIDLVKRGAITNNKKTLNQGKIISSFLIGPKELYDFVDNNPFIGESSSAIANIWCVGVLFYSEVVAVRRADTYSKLLLLFHCSLNI